MGRRRSIFSEDATRSRRRYGPILAIIAAAVGLYLVGYFDTADAPVVELRGPPAATTFPTARPTSSGSIGRAGALAEEPFTHVVEPGDRLATIAATYNVTADAILQANVGLDPDVLQVGQHIRIPGATTVNSRTPEVNQTTIPLATDRPGVAHMVQSGESLATIADTYSVSADHVIAFNGLLTDRLVVGQQLFIPPPEFAIDH